MAAGLKGFCVCFPFDDSDPGVQTKFESGPDQLEEPETEDMTSFKI